MLYKYVCSVKNCGFMKMTPISFLVLFLYINVYFIIVQNGKIKPYSKIRALQFY